MVDENGDNTHRRQPPPEVKVLNPRYKGATPEMVARALLHPRRQDNEGDEET
ncbi:MAG: hypothetical protein OXI95_13770 [bacterium]|nr:hypothetical protein [bacterium]